MITGYFLLRGESVSGCWYIIINLVHFRANICWYELVKPAEPEFCELNNFLVARQNTTQLVNNNNNSNVNALTYHQ